MARGPRAHGREPRLTPQQERAFRARGEAWTFFEAQPPGYRRTIVDWVVSAKREETRERRLARRIEASAAGERLFQEASTSVTRLRDALP